MLTLDPQLPSRRPSNRQRHGLPAGSGVQKALEALLERELVSKAGPGSYRISEPFLSEWLAAMAS